MSRNGRDVAGVFVNEAYRYSLKGQWQEVVGPPEPDELDVSIAIEQMLTRQAQRLTWDEKKYVVREKPDLPEYVWQDWFRPDRRSAVEAFGLTNHTDEAFYWGGDA